MVAVSSRATISTRGVRMSEASRSSKRMAEQMSWLSSASRPPWSSASVTMVTSSSLVMPTSSLVWKTLDSSFFHREKKKVAGVRITMKNRRMGAENRAKLSGDSLARLLGETSPKIKITMVSTTVDTAGPLVLPRRSIKSTADRVVATLLTMLLPIRMVDRS